MPCLCQHDSLVTSDTQRLPIPTIVFWIILDGSKYESIDGKRRQSIEEYSRYHTYPSRPFNEGALRDICLPSGRESILRSEDVSHDPRHHRRHPYFQYTMRAYINDVDDILPPDFPHSERLELLRCGIMNHHGTVFNSIYVLNTTQPVSLAMSHTLSTVVFSFFKTVI